MKRPLLTEGTWASYGNSIISDIGDGEDGICIANIETDGGYEASHTQQEANCRALAAIPQLLEALEQVRHDILRSYPAGMGNALSTIDAALIAAGYTED